MKLLKNRLNVISAFDRWADNPSQRILNTLKTRERAGRKSKVERVTVVKFRRN